MKTKHIPDIIQTNEIITQVPDVNANLQEITNINTTSVTSTNSTSNDNPSSQESTTAAVGSSDGDQKLIDLSNSLLPIKSHSITSCNVHSSENNSSQLPNIVSQSSSPLHSIVTPQAYKPFVWDWVEKHSEMIVDSPNCNSSEAYPFQNEPSDDVQSLQKRNAKHCAKHQQLMKKSRPYITNEQILENNEREGRKRHKLLYYTFSAE